MLIINNNLDTNMDSTLNIATKLLNSSDTKIAEAARRVFALQCDTIETTTPSSSTLNTVSSIPNSIPDEIQQAASAVVMLSPPNNGIKNRTANLEVLDLNKINEKYQQQAIPANTDNDDLDDDSASNFGEKEQMEYEFSSSMKMLVKKTTSPSERLQRSRERNKMHARKTRQRKKEIMHNLEKRVLELKADQINLKQQVNEKNTANILLKMFSTQTQDEIDATDPQLDEIMKRSTEDIPDASKIPELPTLILPGHHTSKKIPSHLDEADTIFNDGSLYPDDGIDYELLGKDRSTCTSEELDKIRKERNRMHAKRTRDRKRIFVDAMEKIIRQLENENTVLQKHLQKISNTHSSVKTTSSPGKQTPFLVSPSINPTCPPVEMTYAINEDLFQQSEEDSSLQECEQISASSLYSDVDDHSGARPPNLSKSSLRENISIITSNTQDYDTARNPSDTGMIHPNKKLCLGIDSTFSRHSSNEIPACTDI